MDRPEGAVGAKSWLEHSLRRRAGVMRVAAGVFLALAIATGALGTPSARGRTAGMLEGMSLEEKVGQLFVTRVHGTTADTAEPSAVAANRAALGVDNAAQLVDRYHVGGVIYFEWTKNLETPTQIARLSNGIQAAALERPSGIPLLISTDQEHGAVRRIGPPVTAFPGSMALGATRSEEDARRAARVAGRELRALGINQNLAPVADVNVNPANPVIGIRSFSSRAWLAASMTAAQVDGFETDAGIASTAKHFPGHGDTNVDSHTGLPVIDHSLQTWRAIDAPPFMAAIEQGVDVIMTAHIAVPALDPSGTPATLSRPIIGDVLRGELGFDGVVMTDSLGMAGVREQYGDDRVPVLALQAGVDLLLNPPRLPRAYGAVLEAVRSGEITEARIDRSVARILALKERLGLMADPFVDPDRIGAVVGTENNRRAAQETADRALTLVRNRDDVLPLTSARASVLVTGAGSTAVDRLAAAIAGRGASARSLPTGSAPSERQIDAAVSAARARGLTVVLVSGLRSSTQQRALVMRLVATGKRVVVVATGSPYDLGYSLSDVATKLGTYSASSASLESVARALYGELSPTGRLPVAVPVPNKPGTVRYPFGHGLGY